MFDSKEIEVWLVSDGKEVSKNDNVMQFYKGYLTYKGKPLETVSATRFLHFEKNGEVKNPFVMLNLDNAPEDAKPISGSIKHNQLDKDGKLQEWDSVQFIKFEYESLAFPAKGTISEFGDGLKCRIAFDEKGYDYWISEKAKAVAEDKGKEPVKFNIVDLSMDFADDLLEDIEKNLYPHFAEWHKTYFPRTSYETKKDPEKVALLAAYKARAKKKNVAVEAEIPF